MQGYRCVPNQYKKTKRLQNGPRQYVEHLATVVIAGKLAENIKAKIEKEEGDKAMDHFPTYAYLRL